MRSPGLRGWGPARSHQGQHRAKEGPGNHDWAVASEASPVGGEGTIPAQSTEAGASPTRTGRPPAGAAEPWPRRAATPVVEGGREEPSTRPSTTGEGEVEQTTPERGGNSSRRGATEAKVPAADVDGRGDPASVRTWHVAGACERLMETVGDDDKPLAVTYRGTRRSRPGRRGGAWPLPLPAMAGGGERDSAQTTTGGGKLWRYLGCKVF